MSHGIIKPIDKVFSTKGAEWHGLADVVPTIDDATVSPLMFSILTGAISVALDGKVVPMGNHKALVADYRFRADLVGTENELVPLHIPKASYQPIENRALWNEMKTALRDVGAEVSCVGTLEAGKKFFISAILNDGGEFTVNNDRFHANLNFITSHDGTLAVQAYDSTVRIVCMNTLRWSLNAAGEVGFKVYHSSGASLAMSNLGELVSAVLSGRAEFRNTMEYLASVACDAPRAELIALGYFAKQTGSDTLATRSKNAAEEIVSLFQTGAGNSGKSLYDLLNGATEYWTGGSGTGKKKAADEKIYAANYGAASDHKSAFANFLSSPSAIEELIEAGGRAKLELVKLQIADAQN